MGTCAESIVREKGDRARGKSSFPVGGKQLNSGIRGGLWDAKHYESMGSAVWLFGWLIHRQTTQRNGRGLVLRGKPLSYATISMDTGFSERSLQRWMNRLQRKGYIEIRYTCYSMMIVWVLNAKKYADLQLRLELGVASFAQGNPQACTPKVAEIGTKSGGLKERVETERKKTNTGPLVRPARLPARNEGQRQYAQTHELARAGEDILRSDPKRDLPSLIEDLKCIAAQRSIPNYGPKASRAAMSAARRIEGMGDAGHAENH